MCRKKVICLNHRKKNHNTKLKKRYFCRNSTGSSSKKLIFSGLIVLIRTNIRAKKIFKKTQTGNKFSQKNSKNKCSTPQSKNKHKHPEGCFKWKKIQFLEFSNFSFNFFEFYFNMWSNYFWQYLTLSIFL